MCLCQFHEDLGRVFNGCLGRKGICDKFLFVNILVDD